MTPTETEALAVLAGSPDSYHQTIAREWRGKERGMKDAEKFQASYLKHDADPEMFRRKYHWLVARLMLANDAPRDLADDLFFALEAESAHLRDEGVECECGLQVYPSEAFYCDDGPTLCMMCAPRLHSDSIAREAEKEAQNG